MIEYDVTTFFTLYGEKSVQTKMPMRGPLKNCGNGNAKKNIEETEMHFNNATKAR